LAILSGIEVDRRRYPLVVMRFGKTFSDAAWQEMAAQLVELVRQGPYGLLNDTRGSAIPTPLQRRWVSRYYEEHDREIRANLLAAAVVGDSMVARGVLTALQWFRPLPHPLQVFATLSDGEEWVLRHFPEALRRQVPRRAGLDTASG
jgi:hypothetical protein